MVSADENYTDASEIVKDTAGVFDTHSNISLFIANVQSASHPTVSLRQRASP